jgi:hypothetical protein
VPLNIFQKEREFGVGYKVKQIAKGNLERKRFGGQLDAGTPQSELISNG